MTDKQKIELKTQTHYIDYTVDKLFQIVEWYQDDTNDWERTMRLYGIEINYTILKYQEGTLNDENYEILTNEYNVCYAFLQHYKAMKENNSN